MHVKWIGKRLIWSTLNTLSVIFYSFSTILASKGAPTFRTRFLEFLIEEYKAEVNINEERNHELNEDVMGCFMGTAFVGIVEWWITKGMPYPPDVMANQVGILLERVV